MPVPSSRIRVVNERPPSPAGDYVLYWMTAARRLQWNFALDRAVELAREFRRPLVVLEALRCDYPQASDRLHRFVLEGMSANARAAKGRPVLYHPYVEPGPGHGRGLVRTLSEHACAVVTDWYPAFFLPRMTAAAAAQCAVRVEAVDSKGLIPIAAHGRAFHAARTYRAFVQRELRGHLQALPGADPLAQLDGLGRLRRVPAALGRWERAGAALLEARSTTLAALPLDHGVGPAALQGGATVAARMLDAFVTRKLARYAEAHNHPDEDCTSRLSPYLHFGHISAHQVFSAVMTRERWTTRRLGSHGGGAREGWWGTSPSAEHFLDQLVVWRELAFNGCEYVRDLDSYEALPEWARQTLEAHLRDPRPHVYARASLEAGETADEVWNAAQRQLVAEGWFHGYLRMLWGKKLVEWTRHPSEALAHMNALMNRYSLDGRDPVSAASYAWVLGRYDRPWPERPIFGTVRCLTSASTRRKLRMRRFLERYGDPPSGRQLRLLR